MKNKYLTILSIICVFSFLSACVATRHLEPNDHTPSEDTGSTNEEQDETPEATETTDTVDAEPLQWPQPILEPPGLKPSNPVAPPFEACSITQLSSEYIEPPVALTNCAHNSEAAHMGRCAVLTDELRAIVQTGSPYVILQKAIVAFYWLAHGPYSPGAISLEYANAVADLSVSGRQVYNSFRLGNFGESDFPTASIRDILIGENSSHIPTDAAIQTSIAKALDRAYTTAWALRGTTAIRQAVRPGLGWIAVSGQDDAPHRPVNVPSANYHQNNIAVSVNGQQVETRYLVATENLIEEQQTFSMRSLPQDQKLTIPPDYNVLIFIHGHSSKAEEALDIIPHLIKEAKDRGSKLAIISMDLPSNGYASVIEHTNIAPSSASMFNTGYPLLDFIEGFIVEFVETLDRQQPGLRNQIVGVIGGSLGGNMGLRLSRRDSATYPWLKNIVAWSPACTWGPSWGRARLFFNPFDNETYFDMVKHEAVRITRDRMNEFESGLNQRGDYFDLLYDGKWPEPAQSTRWLRDDFQPCKDILLKGAYYSSQEVYNGKFRRWHWRVAHEQLIFSHYEKVPGGDYSYKLMKSRLLLAAGGLDNHFPEFLHDNTRIFSNLVTKAPGYTLWVTDTGHSIHTERPSYFAGEIGKFLDEYFLRSF